MSRARSNLREILRPVSRSFYLSIRFLPEELREPIQLAYLLARATDTVADTHTIDAGTRAAALKKLGAAINGDPASDAVAELRANFAPFQINMAERKLIETLPDLLDVLEQCEADDRDDIRQLLAKITRGQMLDVERFGSGGEIRAIATAAELHEYTYLVAGCVGEFWTRLCVRHVPDFSSGNEMELRGRRYGEGLQLINILRDAPADLAAGRCYFPKEELDSLGIRPAQITREPDKFLPVYRRWLDEAQRGLEQGMEYVEAINSPRLRGATVLPALIGARTLALLREAGANALRQHMKVPRRQVRTIIGTVAITMANRQVSRRMFERC